MANETKKEESKEVDSQKAQKINVKKEKAPIRNAVSRFFEEPFRGLPDWLIPNGGWMPDVSQVMGRVFPKVDISETDSMIEVVADVPGIDPEKIKADIRNGVLTISGEGEYEEEREGRMYHRYERRYGSFSRSIPLPKMVDEQKGHAEIKDGVLKVTFPKSPEELKKSIEVEVKK